MLEERIYRDYLQALKDKDRHRIEFLSFIRAELKNVAIELKKDKLQDNQVWEVLKKQKKRLSEIKETALSSNRSDVLRAIEKELAILESYLPQPLSETELSTVIDEVISQLSAISLKDMGRVIKAVLEKVGARAEPKEVSRLVREKLKS
ncbi:MAG TPA: GatB/YqeY domain-containing protein [Candidatus Omnitrophica bacterium]|nr:GatB/YqeY domain-containing protein [Candidatus Omnitrophota bacterium]